MPVQVNRSFVIKSGDQTLVLSPEEIQKAAETEITVTCSGPRCQARNARSEPFSVTWKEEEAAKDPLTLPDAFFQMIKLSANPVKPEELVFCGKICAVDYLNHVYVPPQPPRIALENAKREQEKQLAELNPHLIAGNDKAEYHTTQTPPVVLPPNSGAVLRVVEPQPALCQADGDPGE